MAVNCPHVERRRLESRRLARALLLATALFGLAQPARAQWSVGPATLSSNTFVGILFGGPQGNLDSVTDEAGFGNPSFNYSGTMTAQYNWTGTVSAPPTSYWLVTTTGSSSITNNTGTGSTLTSSYGQPVAMPQQTGNGATNGYSLSSEQIIPKSGSSPSFTETYGATAPTTANGQGGFSLTFSVVPAFTLSVPSTVWIGQLVKPAIGSIPSGYQIVPGSYTWAVTGNTFNGYTPGNPITSGINGPFSDSPSWYWYGTGNGQTALDQVGVSFTAQAPDGSTQQITEQVNVNVVEPQWSASGTPGYCGIGTPSTPGESGVWDQAVPSTQSGVGGMTWSGNVGLGPVSNGSICICQLVVPDQGVYDSFGNWSGINGNVWGLDGNFPYVVASPSWNSNEYNANGSQFSTGDSPGVPLSDSDSQVIIDDEFEDFLMYQPSGQNNVWVPLGTMYWDALSDRFIPAGVNGGNSSWNNWPNGAPSGVVTGGGAFTDSPSSFPTWSVVYSSTQM